MIVAMENCYFVEQLKLLDTIYEKCNNSVRVKDGVYIGRRSRNATFENSSLKVIVV